MSGLIILVAAPSGAGKTTLVRHLLDQEPNLDLSISYTTRSPRVGEVDGKDYHFVNDDMFKKMIDAGVFIEWANVHGNYYGTSKNWIIEKLVNGNDVLLVIDVQGVQQITKVFPEALKVFILPPSIEILKSRLVDRGTDTDDVINLRLTNALAEMSFADEFDVTIVNDDLQIALSEFRACINNARMTSSQ